MLSISGCYNLLKLTERYCVVFQTLSNKPSLRVSRGRPAQVKDE